MVHTARIVLIVYGILLISGGAMGYLQKGSVMSLGAGVIGGCVAIAAALIAGRAPVAGLWIGFLCALVIAAVMLIRHLNTRALMPAGLTLILSVITIFILSLALQALKSSR